MAETDTPEPQPSYATEGLNTPTLLAEAHYDIKADLAAAVAEGAPADIDAVIAKYESYGVFVRASGDDAANDEIFGGKLVEPAVPELREILHELQDRKLDAVKEEYKVETDELLTAAAGSKAEVLARFVGAEYVNGHVSLSERPLYTGTGPKRHQTGRQIEPTPQTRVETARKQALDDTLKSLSPTEQAEYRKHLADRWPRLKTERSHRERTDAEAVAQAVTDAAEAAKVVEEQTALGKARAEVERDHPELWERFHYQRDELPTQAERDRFESQFNEAALKIVADREGRERNADEATRAAMVEHARQQLKTPLDAAREYVDDVRPDIWERYQYERNSAKTAAERTAVDDHFNGLAKEMYDRRFEPVPAAGDTRQWVNEAALRRYDGTEHKERADLRAQIEKTFQDSSKENKSTFDQFQAAITAAPNERLREDLQLRLDDIMWAFEHTRRTKEADEALAEARHNLPQNVAERAWQDAYIRDNWLRDPNSVAAQSRDPRFRYEASTNREAAHHEALKEAYRIDSVARKEMDVAAAYDRLIANSPDASHRQVLQEQKTAAVEATRNLHREALKRASTIAAKVREAALHRVTITERLAGSTPANEAEAIARFELFQMSPQPYKEDNKGGLFHFRGKHRGPRVVESYYRNPANPDIIMVDRRLKKTRALVSQTVLTSYDSKRVAQEVAKVREQDAK